MSSPEPSASPAVEAGPAACAQQLKERFPALFSGAPKPLKLRIQADIQERAPGVFTKQALSAFFRRYTTSTGYLISLTRSANRFDLDGQPAGEVSAEHRDAAAQELARRRARHEEKRVEELRQRRERAQMLRDFERTTLTPANFCALKGMEPEQLDALLAQAREEAKEDAARPRPPESQPHRHRPHERGEKRADAAPRGDRPADATSRGERGERRRDGGPRREGRPGNTPRGGRPER